ncbi:hypothetical protein [Roseobacter sp. AzwK-3b]|uniref:hypothetical protein n=1 Tax=Roseobacter sp. AzwK-3b TaxID=351016 RepID=UPI0002F82E77|nr:hypothetical protein [Roseobacter sp. AzwK-3b]
MTPLSRPSHQSLARPPRSQPVTRILAPLAAAGAHITASQGMPPLGSLHGKPLTRAALAPLDPTSAHITAPQGTPQPCSLQGQPVTRSALIPLDATGTHITAPQGTPQPCSLHGQPVTRTALVPPPTRARHSHGSPTAPADPRSPGVRRLAAARARTALLSFHPPHGNPRGSL